MRIFLLFLIGFGVAAHALAQSSSQLSDSKLLTQPTLSPPLDQLADSKTLVLVIGTFGAAQTKRGILHYAPLTHFR